MERTALLGPGVAAPLKEWFVAFVDHGANLWWHRWCRRGFRHCFAFGYDAEAGRWLVFDPTLEGFYLRVASGEQIDALVVTVRRGGGRIVRAPVLLRGPVRPRVFATCVTVIGHLLGLPRCAVRPYGLYRKLLRYGAVPAFEGVR
jgi:hypothetical protein